MKPACESHVNSNLSTEEDINKSDNSFNLQWPRRLYGLFCHPIRTLSQLHSNPKLLLPNVIYLILLLSYLIELFLLSRTINVNYQYNMLLSHLFFSLHAIEIYFIWVFIALLLYLSRKPLNISSNFRQLYCVIGHSLIISMVIQIIFPQRTLILVTLVLEQFPDLSERLLFSIMILLGIMDIPYLINEMGGFVIKSIWFFFSLRAIGLTLKKSIVVSIILLVIVYFISDFRMTIYRIAE